MHIQCQFNHWSYHSSGKNNNSKWLSKFRWYLTSHTFFFIKIQMIPSQSHILYFKSKFRWYLANHTFFFFSLALGNTLESSSRDEICGLLHSIRRPTQGKWRGNGLARLPPSATGDLGQSHNAADFGILTATLVLAMRYFIPTHLKSHLFWVLLGTGNRGRPRSALHFRYENW